MANRSFIYAANEHYAIVRCSDVPSDIVFSKSKHPEIAETAAFLAVNNWRRLFEFIERYGIVSGRVPMFYRPLDVFDPKEGIQESRDDILDILESAGKPFRYRMRDYNSMNLERYLASVGIHYMSRDFLDSLVLDGVEDYLVLNIGELMELHDELADLVMAASIALGSANSFKAYGQLYEEGKGFADHFALGHLYQAEKGGYLYEVSDSDSSMRSFGFEAQGRTGFELVRAGASSYAVTALNLWGNFAGDGDLRKKYLGHVFSEAKRNYQPLKSQSLAFRFFDGAFLEVPNRRVESWADRYVKTVVIAVLDGRVFTCAECGTPCIGIQTFQDSESKFCSASCKTASSKRNTQSTDNA